MGTIGTSPGTFFVPIAEVAYASLSFDSESGSPCFASTINKVHRPARRAKMTASTSTCPATWSQTTPHEECGTTLNVYVDAPVAGASRGGGSSKPNPSANRPDAIARLTAPASTIDP